ncbi:hypothetical protein DBV15_04338 [Temnothorax longispinosus]|uniref:Uncharacterized protein n=1 Tax=Temnothorax longispinosus TaxID=300112 RepID=A0A4S2K3Y4_9HYME|nr:hypothetical protein DBV15_04338 [Temnothorax longispinosus]
MRGGEKRDDEWDGFQAGSEPLLDFCTSATSPHASPPMKQRKAACSPRNRGKFAPRFAEKDLKDSEDTLVKTRSNPQN